MRQRSQFVIVNGSQSSTVQVTSGVAQGSFLGPLLFLLYTNDIPEGIVSQMRLFADDCVLFRAVACVENANIIQRDLNRKMACAAKLRKTVFMSFTKANKSYSASFDMNNTILSRVLDYKYVGLNYMTHLKCHTLVDYVVAKAGETLRLLRRNSRNSNKNTQDSLYKIYVRSVMKYECVCLGPAYITWQNKTRKTTQLCRLVC